MINHQRVWVSPDRVYAGLEKINEKYPNWSYFFQLNVGSNKIAEYDYITKDKSGINAQNNTLCKFIVQTINKYEEDECTCDPQILIDIGNTLQIKTLNKWSVICDPKGVTTAIVKSHN